MNAIIRLCGIAVMLLSLSVSGVAADTDDAAADRQKDILDSGQYSMSKHAIEAYTDSLAAEMAPLGVQVSVIEPGNYDSKIADTAINRLQAMKDEYAREGSPFAEDFEKWISRSWDRSQYKDPGEVADAALHALFDDKPLRRYMVVPNEQEAGWTIGKAVEELVQLNEGQAYAYSREQLIAMLDATMAGDDAAEDGE